MRTFSRSRWEEAQAAWAEAGPWSTEWRELRHVMAMQGSIYPPAGSRHDGWDDDQPSQRAVIIRALRETPQLLTRCAKGAGSWSVLIERLLRERDDWREDLAEREQAARRAAAALRPVHREAAMSIGQILERLAASRGLDDA